ncbi:hypothetical protein L7F22_052907 [Adiantum nelumboides]|nr:hypothetical protein [Adiantum nelumboides]
MATLDVPSSPSGTIRPQRRRDTDSSGISEDDVAALRSVEIEIDSNSQSHNKQETSLPSFSIDPSDPSSKVQPSAPSNPSVEKGRGITMSSLRSLLGVPATPATAANSSPQNGVSSPSTASKPNTSLAPPSKPANKIQWSRSTRGTPKYDCKNCTSRRRRLDFVKTEVDGINNSSSSNFNHQINQKGEQVSPSSEDTFSTPELGGGEGGSGSGSSNGTPSPFTPTRNPYTNNNFIRLTAKSPKIEGVMAARDRPVFKQEQHGRSTSTSSNESGSSGSLTSMAANRVRNNGPPPSAARRQLMPTIPTRKTSSNTLSSNNGKDSASSTPQASPNLGNQTNIQNLAQAIAARAQHVAAAKAALRQQQQQQQTKEEQSMQDTNNVNAAPTSESASRLQPSLVPRGSIVSIVTAASDYGDAESDAENTEEAKQRNIRKDRSDVAQSFRWSQGDWADYAAALSDQIDVGATPTDQDHQPHEGILVAAPTMDAITSSRSTTHKQLLYRVWVSEEQNYLHQHLL